MAVRVSGDRGAPGIQALRRGTAVHGVSFTIERGCICALLGANGAGKTTTLAMLLGLVTPSTGSIRVLGHDLPGSAREAWLARPAAKRGAVLRGSNPCYCEYHQPSRKSDPSGTMDKAVQPAPAGKGVHYERRRPEDTVLYQLVEEHLETFLAQVELETGAGLPEFVEEEFDAFLECGILRWLVAFSCKRRGFCPGCGARRMVETAAYLVDHLIPRVPVRQWVLSFPIPLRVLFAAHPELLTPALRIAHRVIATFLIKQAGLKRAEAATGAVTLIQRFGSAICIAWYSMGSTAPPRACRYSTPCTLRQAGSYHMASAAVSTLRVPYCRMLN
jgi:energy-coupling factor transporter ATP-binding protein EcfA2